jgi:hypothetical protein
MSQWKGFQLVVIVDLRTGNCLLVSFLAIHHNHCVINEFCVFNNFNKNLPFKTITIHLQLM